MVFCFLLFSLSVFCTFEDFIAHELLCHTFFFLLFSAFFCFFSFFSFFFFFAFHLLFIIYEKLIFSFFHFFIFSYVVCHVCCALTTLLHRFFYRFLLFAFFSFSFFFFFFFFFEEAGKCYKSKTKSFKKATLCRVNLTPTVPIIRLSPATMQHETHTYVFAYCQNCLQQLDAVYRAST